MAGQWSGIFPVHADGLPLLGLNPIVFLDRHLYSIPTHGKAGALPFTDDKPHSHSTKRPEMTTDQLLTGSHLRTYNKIFLHPASHNLEWREVHMLLAKLGHIGAEVNGNMKVTRNGHSLILRPHHTKDVEDTDELVALRHFIERSESKNAEPEGGTDPLLLVIDHHEARLFRSTAHGASPLQILPHEPSHFFRHAHNSKDFSRGQEKPDPNSFFEPVAHAMRAASHILVFGTGTGSSSEMDQFIAWLKSHHPELSGRVIGALVVDEHHLTEGQLLAKARDFYASAGTAPK